MNDRHRHQGTDQGRGRWTEQGQDGGYYDAGRDQDRHRNSPYAQGQGGYEQGHSGTYGRYDRGYDDGDRSRGASAQANRGGIYGQPAFGGGDHWNTRSGAGEPGAYYGQANMGPSGHDQGRGQGMEPGGWSQGAYGPSRASSSGYGGPSWSSSRQEDYARREPWQSASRPQPSGSHHDFEPDYLHWREQQMSNFDRDYHDWRSEKRERFSSDFDTWRSSRGPAVQAENSVVGDVTDGGPGSQTHAKATHDDKPAKH